MNLPQRCPGCLQSLRDPSVHAPLSLSPAQRNAWLHKYRKLFTLAEIDMDADPEPGRTAWVHRPGCGHQWTTAGIA